MIYNVVSTSTVSFFFCVYVFVFVVVVVCSAGDVIELINTGSIDWWKGGLAGKTGYFPAAYVQV